MIKLKDYKCPNCGGNKFCLSYFYQSTRDYKVLKNGKLSKKYTVSKDLPTDVAILHCSNCGESIDYWSKDKDGCLEVDE